MKEIKDIIKDTKVNISKDENPDKSESKQEWKGGKYKKGMSGNPKGKPKGIKCKKTIEKEIAKEEFRQRVLRSMNELINAQMNIAQGCQMLFKLETKRYKDKSGKWQEKQLPPRLVEDQRIIEAYLAGELKDDQGNPGAEDDGTYYFITTAKPENKALDSLMDRVFGKPEQSVTMKGDSKNPLEINITSDEKSTINKTLARYMANTPKQGK